MPTEKLIKLLSSPNIASDIEKRDDGEHELARISSLVLEELEEDERSMEDWLEYADKAMELTEAKREEKNSPFKNAANIKYPLITTAVIQFSSRTLPELIKNGEVARYKVIGHDPDRRKERKGIRIKTHLNWQILEKMPNWMDERDRLHHQLAVVGTSYSKTWFDPIEGVNRSELIPYEDIVVNNNIKNLETAPRVSQYLYLSANEIVEHIRWGLFREVDVDCLAMDVAENDCIYHELIEQHRYLDLDDDGYEEPYIVTIHKASNQVLRIVARYGAQDILYNDKKEVKKIYPTLYFTDYHFIPNPNGTFHSLGFGTLLLDMNATVNTILNQLINAGHLATIQGGFISKSLKIRKEDFEVDPGEWIYADSATGASIKDNVVPFNYKEPSMVLFQLLGMLIEGSQSLTSTTDSLTGTGDTVNVSPNTLMALIQQGLKVYSAIQRRIFRGFKKELQKLVKLNSINVNVEEYVNLIDPSEQELMEMFDSQSGRLLDYDLHQIDIIPVVDSNTSTEAENLARSQTEIAVGLQLGPGVVNLNELARNAFSAMESPNIDKLVLPYQPPGPDPKAIEIQSKIDKTSKELQFQVLELQMKAAKADAEIKLIHSQAVKNIADAEAAEVGSQLENYKYQASTLGSMMDRQQKDRELTIKENQVHAKASANGVSAGDKTAPSLGATNDQPSLQELVSEALNRGMEIDDSHLPSHADVQAEIKNRGL